MVLDAGRFFRAEGGNAEPFGTPQSDSISNHNHPFSFQHTHAQQGTFTSGGISANHTHGFDTYTDWTDINHSHNYDKPVVYGGNSSPQINDGNCHLLDTTTTSNGMNSMGSDSVRSGTSHRHHFSGTTGTVSSNHTHDTTISGNTGGASVSSGTTSSTGDIETRPINYSMRVWKRIS